MALGPKLGPNECLFTVTATVTDNRPSVRVTVVVELPIALNDPPLPKDCDPCTTWLWSGKVGVRSTADGCFITKPRGTGEGSMELFEEFLGKSLEAVLKNLVKRIRDSVKRQWQAQEHERRRNNTNPKEFVPHSLEWSRRVGLSGKTKKQMRQKIEEYLKDLSPTDFLYFPPLQKHR